MYFAQILVRKLLFTTFSRAVVNPVLDDNVVLLLAVLNVVEKDQCCPCIALVCAGLTSVHPSLWLIASVPEHGILLLVVFVAVRHLAELSTAHNVVLFHEGDEYLW